MNNDEHESELECFGYEYSRPWYTKIDWEETIYIIAGISLLGIGIYLCI